MLVMDFQLHPFGERAVIIEFGKEISPVILEEIRFLTSYLEESKPKWMIEYIPAFTTITILYDATTHTYAEICQQIEALVSQCPNTQIISHHVVEVPVCYEGKCGPDLAFVAQVNGLTKEEVIQIHSSGDYLVYMIGFAPGFPYIGGMSERIATRRKDTPRLEIPSGSVGIAGLQTGIYPISTPGGWQIIGRTPIKLFSSTEEHPSLLRTGDKVKFVPITYKQFKEWEKVYDDNNP